MKSIRVLAHTLVASTAIIAAVPIGAHSIWFAQRATKTALIYGEGADDLDAVKRLPMVKAVAGYDAAWKPVATSLKVAGVVPLVESEQSIAAVTAVMDYGLWSKTPDGEWHNKGRDEVPTATLAEHNWKYAVHLTQLPKSPLPLFAGQTLQIVPVGATIPEKMGAPLKVRVVFEGKPVAGASLLSDYVNDPDQTPVKTAVDGTATIKLRNQGLNVLVAIYNGPADDKAKVDHMEHRASLSFTLPHKEE